MENITKNNYKYFESYRYCKRIITNILVVHDFCDFHNSHKTFQVFSIDQVFMLATHDNATEYEVSIIYASKYSSKYSNFNFLTKSSIKVFFFFFYVAKRSTRKKELKL